MINNRQSNPKIMPSNEQYNMSKFTVHNICIEIKNNSVTNENKKIECNSHSKIKRRKLLPF